MREDKTRLLTMSVRLAWSVLMEALHISNVKPELTLIHHVSVVLILKIDAKNAKNHGYDSSSFQVLLGCKDSALFNR